MKIYFSNTWKHESRWIRTFDLIPSISYNAYKDYSFESVRFSWLGFLIGFYKEE